MRTSACSPQTGDHSSTRTARTAHHRQAARLHTAQQIIRYTCAAFHWALRCDISTIDPIGCRPCGWGQASETEPRANHRPNVSRRPATQPFYCASHGTSVSSTFRLILILLLPANTDIAPCVAINNWRASLPRRPSCTRAAKDMSRATILLARSKFLRRRRRLCRPLWPAVRWEA